MCLPCCSRGLSWAGFAGFVLQPGQLNPSRSAPASGREGADRGAECAAWREKGQPAESRFNLLREQAIEPCSKYSGLRDVRS